MNTILEKIIADKRIEVERMKGVLPLSEIINKECTYERFDFKRALSDNTKISIIAEIKKASPSKGMLCEDFDPQTLAEKYRGGGAAAISVLTDRKYFQGDGSYIGIAKKAAHLPVLCKDFIIDPYQIYLARHWGADAVLLICACLKAGNLAKYISLCGEIGLASLVEVHNDNELRTALTAGAEIIGVNNRNLDTFETDLGTSEKLSGLIPDDRIKVSESGISTRKDIDRLSECGYSNFLIGESIVRSGNIVEFIRGLVDDKN